MSFVTNAGERKEVQNFLPIVGAVIDATENHFKALQYSPFDIYQAL